MSELSQANLEAALRAALPEHLRGRAPELAAAILRATQDGAQPEADPEALRALSGARLKVGGALVDFGTGNQFGDINIQDVVGGDKYTINLTVPPEPWRIPEEDVPACPYPGLAVFGGDEAPYFFGRDADIVRLVARAGAPIAAVTGPSGVGKSSLVLAGVLPRLRDQDPALTTIVFRVSTSAQLLGDLAATLAGHAGRPAEELLAELGAGDAAALGAILLAPGAAGRVILVLDQFEELFVGTDEQRVKERGRLLDMLLEIERQADPRLLVILTSRENYFEHRDYLARPELRPIIVERGVALAGLSDLQLAQAIQGPLDAFNARPERQGRPPIVFETGVLKLLEQEFRRTERTLPLVQYLLRLLWTEQRELSRGAYTTLGGLERALDRHASKIYDSFTTDEQQLVRAVLLALVRPGIDNEYTRRRVPRDTLIGGGSQHDQVVKVVGRLANQDSRLLSEQHVGQVVYLELTHEILLRQWDRLRILIDTSRKELELRERLLPVAEQWQLSLARTNGKGDTAHLYRGSQFAQARDYIEKSDLPEGVDTGIKACFQASARYRRRQWTTIALGTAALLVLLGVGVTWFNQQIAVEQQRTSERATAEAQARQTAEAEAIQRATAEAQASAEAARAAREAEISNSLRLANQARQLLAQGNRPLAVTLALEANSIADPPLQAQLALAEVAYAPGYARDLPAPPEGPAEPCVFETTQGRRTIRVDQRQSQWFFELYDVDRNALIRSTSLDGINGNPSSANNEYWVVPKWCEQVSPDGNYALIGLNIPNFAPGEQGVIDGELVLWDLTTGAQIKSFPSFAGQAFFSPDSTRVAYASLDDSIKIWDLAAQLDRISVTRAQLPFFWSPSGDVLLASGTEPNDVAVFAVDIFGATEFIRWSGAGVPAGFAPDGASVYIENAGLQEWGLGNAAQMLGQRGNFSTELGAIAGYYWLRVSPAGGRVVLFSRGTDSGTVLLSAANNYTELDVVEPAEDMGSFVYTLPIMSSDGTTVLIVNGGDPYRLDVTSGKLSPVPLDSWQYEWNPIALSDDGRRALIDTGSPGSSTIVVDLVAGTVLRSFEEPERNVSGIGLSADGSRAFVLSRPSDSASVQAQPLKISVWDVESGTRQQVLELGAGELQAAGSDAEVALPGSVLNSDRTRLATVAKSGELQLWDMTAGAMLWSIPATGGALAFSPDGSVLAQSPASGGPVLLLDASDGQRIATLTDAASPFAFSPDGTLIATAGVDRLLHVFDVASGAEIRRFDDAPLDLAFHPDGRSILTSGQDLKRWRMDSLPELIEWTKANRTAAALTCAQRVLYQVPPLCPPGTEETPAPTATPDSRPTPTVEAASPTPAEASSPTAPPTMAAATLTPVAPTPAAQGSTYRVIVTSDGFVAVRERPTRQSAEVQRLTAGTEIICTEIVTGEEIAGSNQWASCPAVGGYIYRPLLEP